MQDDQTGQGSPLQPLERRWSVEIPSGPVRLAGFLDVPVAAQGIVLFAHGSGSGRLSPRNQYVAEVLIQARIATLLFDLLTDAEALDRQFVFDISLLANRLRRASEWVRQQAATQNLPMGYFGASTGAAAALVAAAAEGPRIRAVVSRGGRPDLAGAALPLVTAPTLLIVGGLDEPVISLNKLAYDELRSPKRLDIVPGATHLFEEPGTLTQAAYLARDWFMTYLPRKATA